MQTKALHGLSEDTAHSLIITKFMGCLYFLKKRITSKIWSGPILEIYDEPWLLI